MFIEKIELSGFRSFRNGTVAGLSSKLNVIIGPNGSGKSSIVTALEFVLTRNYARLNNRHRNELICNVVNGNQRSTNASVTVWLDNSDQSFPIKEAKISIKRVLSTKADQYFVNDRLKSFDELAVMLESAGFSPNNSHFLVRQGFVTEIAFGSPKELLNTLRGISGAASFEEKKEKALKLIGDSEEKIASLEGRVTSIEEQLKLLNIDRKKVKDFQSQTKVRRYLTGRIARLDSETVRKEMDRLKAKQKRLVSTLDADEKELSEYRQALQETSTLLKDIDTKVNEAQEAHKANILMTRQNELIINTLQEEISELEQLSQDIDELPMKRAEKKEKQLELTTLNVEITTIDDQLKEIQAETDALEERIKNVIELARMNKTDSQTRDDQIQARLKDLEMEKSQQEKFWGICQEQLKELKNSHANLSKDDIVQLGKDIARKKDRISSLTCQKNDLETERRRVMTSTSAIQKNILELENKVKKMSSNLNVFSGNSAIGSREAIQKLLVMCEERLAGDDLTEAQRAGLQSVVDGYYGQFVDCVHLDEELPVETRNAVYKPIESLLKNRIFHHLVASDQVANDILKLLKQCQDRGWSIDGNFKFIALNRLPACRDDEGAILQDEHNIQPLVSYFECIKPEAENGVKYLCRRLYICESFRQCAELRALGRPFDFSTLEGDKIDRNGVISFTPDRHLTKYQQFELFKEQSDKLAHLKQQLSDLNVAYTMTSTSIDKCDEEMESLKDKVLHHAEQLENARNYEKQCRFEEKVEKLEEKVNVVKAKLDCSNTEINFWTKELEEPTDANEIEEIVRNETGKINECKRNLSKLKNERGVLWHRKQELSMTIAILEKQINHLFSRKIKLANSRKSLEKLTKQRVNYETKNQEYLEESAQLLQKISQLMEESSRLKSEKSNLKDSVKAKERKITEIKEKSKSFSGELEELHSRALNFQMDAEKYGAFRDRMEGELARYANMSYDELNQTLRAVNNKINQITQGRLTEETMKRFDEMQTSVAEMNGLMDNYARNMEAIRELIHVIEGKKLEIIERTYKQVNQYFQEIFRELVPSGSVRLQFTEMEGARQRQPPPPPQPGNKRSRNRRRDSTESDDSIFQPPSNELASTSTSLTQSTQDSAFSSSLDMSRKLTALPSGEKYVGLEITKISFSDGETVDSVMALSGGQRALVSLAFIFALQKVDPTPFYIFDEVDSNLDEAKREDVARLISNFAEKEKKQFILTTFHRQTAEIGDRFFGVINENRLSKVQEIDMQVALESFMPDISRRAGQEQGA